MLQDRPARADNRPAIVVASGPSAAGFVPPKGCTVIAVNGAIEWLRGATHWFTLDPSEANQRRMRQPKDGVIYSAAVDPKAPLPTHINRYFRWVGQRPEPAEKHTPEWWAWRWSAAFGLTSPVRWINTGNSAWGALQLAYKLGAKKCALVGVDANTEPRIEGGECNNLSHLPMLFESALGHKGFEFINCGHMQSKVPQMTIEEGMKWLTK